MIARGRVWGVLLVGAWLLVGCGGDEAPPLAGTYALDRVALVAALEDVVGLPPQRAAAEAQDTIVRLVLRSDGTFRMARRPATGPELVLSGTWTQSGATARLAATRADDRALEAPREMVARWQDDRLRLLPAAGANAATTTYPLVLRRAEP